MRKGTKDDCIDLFEEILKEKIKYNEEKSMARSENAVARRLLERAIEMRGVFLEIYSNVGSNKTQISEILHAILFAAAYYHPDKAKRARDIRSEIASTNARIVELADELADALEFRTKLVETSGFTSGAEHHIAALIESSSKDNYWFNWNLRDPLLALRRRYDGKYWPSLEDVVREIAIDSEQCRVEPLSSVLAAATHSSRASKADFVRALIETLEDGSSCHGGWIPDGFRFSDNSIATIMNCALALNDDELVDSSYVKRLRQRDRENRAEDGEATRDCEF